MSKFDLSQYLLDRIKEQDLDSCLGCTFTEICKTHGLRCENAILAGLEGLDHFDPRLPIQFEKIMGGN